MTVKCKLIIAFPKKIKLSIYIYFNNRLIIAYNIMTLCVISIMVYMRSVTVVCNTYVYALKGRLA